MANISFDGNDGLVEYLAGRFPERGHTLVSREAMSPGSAIPCDAFVRVVDPAREPFAAHVDAITAAARSLPRGAVTISVVTRHDSRVTAKYKQAAKGSCVHHGVAGVRSAGVVTDEVRDPTRTGMNPIAHDLHQQLFPGVDPECVVLAIEVALVLDGRSIVANGVGPWLVAGAGTVREELAGYRLRDLIDKGYARASDPMMIPAQLVGEELAARLPRDLRPVDFENGRNLDDPDSWIAEWVAAINAELDTHHAREPRRAWIASSDIVAFTSAREWAMAPRR